MLYVSYDRVWKKKIMKKITLILNNYYHLYQYWEVNAYI